MKISLGLLAALGLCYSSVATALPADNTNAHHTHKPNTSYATQAPTIPPMDKRAEFADYKTHDEPAESLTILDEPTKKPHGPTPKPTRPVDQESEESSPEWSGTHVQYAIRAGTTQARAVNLGGWLMTEQWMTNGAEVFHDLDASVGNGGEQQVFTHTKPRDLAIQRFTSFRGYFITENEIARIAAAGLNMVRVPIGYWIIGFDNHDPSNAKQWTNYAPGGLDVLDRLIKDWAKKHNVAVMLSMHGAKGSQNGADHSAPEQPGKSLWSHYPENVASTLDAVTFLAARYKNEDAFLGIGLMNEPSGDTNRGVLYKYYEDAYWAIRVIGQNDCILTIAPLLWEQSPDHMTEVLPGARNVWVEWHRYFVWGWEQTSAEQILGAGIDDFRRDVVAWKQRSNKKMFIGEFSVATAGKINDERGLAQFAQRQLSVLLGDVNGGWAFWSWRVYGDEYGANPWSMRSLLDRGVFPRMA